MTYDNEGRLVSWTASSGTTASDEFLYDAEGNRVLQRSSVTSGGTTTVSDIITFDGFTDTTITDGTSSTITYYNLAGQPIAMTNGTGWFSLVPDVLGSTTMAVNGSGAVQAVELYTPYGAVRYSDGTMPTAYNFTGQRLDTQTGLLYYGARYYDPTSAGFLAADDVQGNAQGINPYAYVKGNPETFTDPTGTTPTGAYDDPGPWQKVWIWIVTNGPDMLNKALIIYYTGLTGMAPPFISSLPNDTIPPNVPYLNAQEETTIHVPGQGVIKFGSNGGDDGKPPSGRPGGRNPDGWKGGSARDTSQRGGKGGRPPNSGTSKRLSNGRWTHQFRVAKELLQNQLDFTGQQQTVPAPQIAPSAPATPSVPLISPWPGRGWIQGQR